MPTEAKITDFKNHMTTRITTFMTETTRIAKATWQRKIGKIQKEPTLMTNFQTFKSSQRLLVQGKIEHQTGEKRIGVNLKGTPESSTKHAQNMKRWC